MAAGVTEAVPAETGRPQHERYELLRALGAVADSPAGAASTCAALGLTDPGAAAHTEAFVLNCPPYAAVYLGEAGGLGGEAADRVAGFWRAMGMVPPAEPDHLTALLSLYASLGTSAREAGRPAIAQALERARRALFDEHLWPWLPGYLDAVAELQIPVLTDWAVLTLEAVRAEHAAIARQPAGPLPLALRSAPPPVAADGGLDDLLDALTAPIRSGFILTRQRLAAGAADAEVGYRIGERRFSLRAMLEQAPGATLGWLAGEAWHWQRRHASRADGDPVHGWWAERAAQTARTLEAAAGLADAAVADPSPSAVADPSPSEAS